MPELPEVETVRKTLYPLLLHHKIIDVRVFMNKVIKTSTPQIFINKIIGQTINDIKRVGKLIIFVLDDYVLLSHLRMEGKYYYQKQDTPTNWKHILLVLELENNYQLCYHDTRQFGTFHLQPLSTYQTLKPYTNIGPEPFNKIVTAQYLQNKWKNKKQNIKASLLDQGVMSGLGNIYVDEVLFYANIHPESITNHLTLVQLQTIIDKSIMVLTKAIKLGGSSINSYTSSLGVRGYYQNSLQVHTRVNQSCFACTTKILKTKVSTRGTYFCPHCQSKY
ncbi:DNA-formamidopyrimidine glycosylase [Spiroplasma endosymbiont of Virgichneumon dumeticola]|uniref:DNA-formamidopyrimidine glycosylase n=1 Tax=Spiroplasma endosymbiont of Virgichneumon dumeticola TaxID=3139323 RepID=UPI0035C922E1